MGERETEAEKEKRERDRARGWRQRGCGCRDPLQGSGGGGAAGSSRGCFRCTPYQPAARCSDPMPMSEKSIVPGQGRGQREPQLQCGEGSWGTGGDLLALLPGPLGSLDWTTWCLWGLLLQSESGDLWGQSGAPGSTWIHVCV